MILHILTQGPDSAAFTQCLEALSQGDGLLLIHNGVYCDLQRHLSDTRANSLYALTEDRLARGLKHQDAGVELIDYAAMVALTLEYDKAVTWS